MMESSLTWLDYSEKNRRRALEVIDQFRDTDTLDELGLGSIVRGFSDLFFPGTSTIQTRACYFLLVPWMFLQIEHRKITSSKAAQTARRMELELSRQLCAGNDTWGIFGRQAGNALKRLPSEVYWAGLGSWGIRIFPSRMSAYFRSLDTFYRRKTGFRNATRDMEGRSAPPTNWHPYLPDPPSDFLKTDLSVALRPQDAQYLRERIQTKHPESLLGTLAGQVDPQVLDAERPWELTNHIALTPRQREHLDDARLFALCMQGAAILYNLMLSEIKQHEQWRDEHQNNLERWAAEIDAAEDQMRDWEPDGVWRTVHGLGRRVAYPTRDFVEQWLTFLKREGPRGIADHPPAQRLIEDREKRLKRSRSRFTSTRHLELWGGASGIGLMDYRWNSAKGILRDIFDGLT